MIYRNLKPGQRVLASFDRPEKRLGVISGEAQDYGDLVVYPVQFEPAGAHYGCSKLSPFGNTDGWTEQEYRIEREKATSRERAANVEAERREKYPDAPFSAYVELEVAR